MLDGRARLAALRTGGAAPAPYIPLLGGLAAALGQVDRATLVSDAQTQAVILAQAAAAVGADVVTVGLGADPAVGAAAAGRIAPLLAGRGVAGCLTEADVAGARAYGEAGAGLVLLVAPDRAPAGRFRTLANACGFYQALAVLMDPTLGDEAPAVAAGLGLHGAVVATPTGAEPGVVGGGLDPLTLAPSPGGPPRPDRFFWSFPGEAPPDADPEALAALAASLGSP